MAAAEMKTVLLLVLSLAASARAEDGAQQFASLGDLKLESGETLKDCRLGYRVFGKLDDARSNAILFPTWFSGTSGDLIDMVGSGKLADSSKYFVVLVDALGNGVSSSPSNSAQQPHMKFPKISIRDMVEAEHLLLTKVLHIEHLRAVIGISMGGMQTFQWLVSHPTFMDYGVPIVGSTRLTSYDLMLWMAQNDAITSDPAWNGGEYKGNPARGPRFELYSLASSSPRKFNAEVPREKVAEQIEAAKKDPDFDANDFIRQCQAMQALDVSKDFGGSMEKAAAAVKARVLVVVSLQDRMVNPDPAVEFARYLKADLMALDSECGHGAFVCEHKKVVDRVAPFLAAKR